MKIKARCRYCDTQVSYFGEICEPCCDGLEQDEAQERTANDELLALTRDQNRRLTP